VQTVVEGAAFASRSAAANASASTPSATSTREIAPLLKRAAEAPGHRRPGHRGSLEVDQPSRGGANAGGEHVVEDEEMLRVLQSFDRRLALPSGP
jgi:hypothetical protein